MLAAVPIGTAAAQFRLDTFNTSNGLPQNTVSAVAQTKDGYLWIATYDGLARFDGVRFTTFDHGNTPAVTTSRFLTLFEDSKGTLWGGGTSGGLVRYRDGKFTSFTTRDGLADDYIGRIQESPRGMLLFHSDGTPPSIWTPDNRSIAADDAALSEVAGIGSTRWIRTDGTVSHVSSRGTTRYALDISADEFGRFRYVETDGSLWLGTKGHGIYHLINGQVLHYGVNEGVPAGDRIKAAGRDRDGEFWIHSEHEVLRSQNGRFVPVDFNGPSLGIRTALVDREGTTWVGSNIGGLTRLTPSFLRTYSQAEGLPFPVVYAVLEDSAGQMIVGSGPNIAGLNGERFTISTLPKPVHALHLDRAGTLWIGSTGGLYAKRGQTVTDHSSLIGNATIEVIIQDRRGTLWAGSNQALFRIDGNRVRRLTKADGLPGAVATLLEDKVGRILVGTERGLARVDGDRIVPFASPDSLAEQHVRALYQDSSGALWIGTSDDGLVRFRDGKYTRYTSAMGMATNGVFAILEDRRGWFWFSSNRGISRVSRAQLEEVAAGRRAHIGAITYGTSDGMRSAECNGGRQPAGIVGRDGRLWFATQDGVVGIDPERAYRDTPPPMVVFESVRIDGEPVDFRGPIRVEPGRRDIELTYTAPTFSKADGVQFRYKLEGINDEWVEARTQRSLHYSQLSPGRYTLLVQASNSEGRWNGGGSPLELIVVPHFYQTRWFAIVVLLSALGLGAAGSAARVRRLEAAERRLTAQVAARTADLAAANERLEQLAASDGLTGLANRRRFDEFLDGEWRRAVRAQTPVALLLMDVDFFKKFNDRYGHQAGDECLKRVARALAGAANRPSDLAARYGGEEFALVLGLTAATEAATIAESIRQSVEALMIPNEASSVGPHVTISIGVAAIVPIPESIPGELIAAADSALYAAKHAGRNRVASAATDEAESARLPVA